MEPDTIINASLIDILFDGKNKEYGAYELRKNYNRRIAIAIISMSFFCLLFFLTQILANNDSNRRKTIPTIEVTLKSLKEPEEKLPELPKVQQKEIIHKVEITKLLTPVIAKDKDVNANVAANDGAAIGNYTVKVQFIVDKEGRVSDVHAIEVPAACPGCGRLIQTNTNICFTKKP